VLYLAKAQVFTDEETIYSVRLEVLPHDDMDKLVVLPHNDMDKLVV